MIDPRLTTTTITLGDWPLSRVFLKNNAQYPWFILVPRVAFVRDIDELEREARHRLIDEIAQLSSLVRRHFKPDKLNVGTLGNIVPQLHIHIVARFKNDSLWPHGIWQADIKETPYTNETLQPLLDVLRKEIASTVPQTQGPT